jgi:hypothetical protein
VREHLDRARAKNLVTVEEAADLQALARRATSVAKGYLRYLNAQAERRRQTKRDRRKD